MFTKVDEISIKNIRELKIYDDDDDDVNNNAAKQWSYWLKEHK